jgi:hypothetical protein
MRRFATALSDTPNFLATAAFEERSTKSIRRHGTIYLYLARFLYRLILYNNACCARIISKGFIMQIHLAINAETGQIVGATKGGYTSRTDAWPNGFRHLNNIAVIGIEVDDYNIAELVDKFYAPVHTQKRREVFKHLQTIYNPSHLADVEWFGWFGRVCDSEANSLYQDISFKPGVNVVDGRFKVVFHPDTADVAHCTLTINDRLVAQLYPIIKEQDEDHDSA